MHDALNSALRLQPLIESPQTFAQFLSELKGNEDRVATAPSVVLRAIEAMGKEDYKEESNQERRQYLQLLETIDTPSWKAFKHVCGSQHFANKLLRHFLEPAATGGAQLRKMLIIEGGPGCGKDYLKDGIERALDLNAQVFAVQGCPERENPLNLLKLLPEEQLERVAQLSGFSANEMEHLLETAGSPCQHCYSKVMGTIAEPQKNPSLDQVMVEKISLSSRSTGVFEWNSGQDYSLVAALRKANRGFLSMPDAFVEQQTVAGKTDERLVLLEATQYRRLPGLCSSKESTVSTSPLDLFILASTNKNTLTRFLSTLGDKDAFTSRCDQIKMPYNLVLVEETRAYQEEMKRYEKAVGFDPLALRMIATLAVLSRYAVSQKGIPFIDPISKMRLLQGERIKVTPETDWAKFWQTENMESKPNSASNNSSGNSTTLESLPEDTPVSPELMWSLIGPDEGMLGLDMRFMMSTLSRINQYGLTKGARTIAAFEAIMILRQLISISLKDNNNLTTEQIAVLGRCKKWLSNQTETNSSGSGNYTAKPGLIEGEYRRLVKEQIVQAFCPDYETRAQEIFEEYVLHATAWATGEKKARHPIHGSIKLNEDLLNELDLIRLGKPSGVLNDDEVKFRSLLTAYLADKKDEFMQKECGAKGLEPDCQKARELRIELAKSYKATWKTVPELAMAIATKLNTEIGELLEKLLNTEVISELKQEERNRLNTAQEYLEKLGYSKPARAMVLNYARKAKIWNHNQN